MGILIVLLVGFGLIIAVTKKDRDVGSAFVFDQTSFDFGTVKQSSESVVHDFPFTYSGTQTVTVTGLPTSCGCTAATITPTVLAPGTRGVVTVRFDPNLHAEPSGHFYKTVSLLTDPALLEPPELKIWASIDLDLGEDAYKEQAHEGEVLLETEDLSPEKDYRTISASTLKEALEDKHFFLVDVHVPEQTHIKGTDAVVPFDQVAQRIDAFPRDKDEKIVLYCRSGSMSQQAAQALADLGYTDVSHVEGGIQAFNELEP